MSDPFRACCADCGKEDMKRNMKTICVRDYGTTKVFCHLCHGCFNEWASGLEIDINNN